MLQAELQINNNRLYLYGLIVLCLIYAAVAFIWMGSSTSPQHPWNVKIGKEEAIFNLGKIQTIKSVEYHNGLGAGELELAWSRDGLNWIADKNIIIRNPFAEMRWLSNSVNATAQYFKVHALSSYMHINEIILRDENNNIIPVTLQSGPAEASALFDEQNTAVRDSNSFNGMYFDEIYHARGAFQILQGMPSSETTHPPLGKMIIAAGIWIFGMNPFGFRVMGVLFGIFMLPVFFGLAHRLFYSMRYAFVATVLFALDFMHFTQTRIATIDTYAVFFLLAAFYWMVRFFQSDPTTLNSKTDKRSLILSGLFFGLCLASKWIAFNLGFGLALLFFWKIIRHRALSNWVISTMLIAICAFVFIPVVIYCLSYLPELYLSGQGVKSIWQSQIGMWNYHSQMQATHPFASSWYEWPLNYRPMFYYLNSGINIPGQRSEIFAMGNPVIWYLGSLSFLVALFRMIRLCLIDHKKIIDFLRNLSDEQRSKWSYARSLTCGIILIGGLSQYLPWALSPRKLTFIYHFFPTVPFLILALVWCLQMIEQKYSRIKITPWIIVTLAAVCFIFYYPVISGLPVNALWVELIRKIL